LTADDLKAFFDHGATRMLTDKEGLGCTRRANGAEKQQTSCKRAYASFDFSPPIPLCGIIHAHASNL